MNTFLRRMWVCLSACALLGGSMAAGQDPDSSATRKARDDSRSATAKTDGANQATGTDPAAENETSKAAMEKPDQQAKTKAKPEEEFVRKTDAEWRKTLTRVQYMVTRQKGTEPPFSGAYASGHFRGTFLCVCCDAELFNAQNKFDSGTGWPSFDRPANGRSLNRDMDYAALEPRIEVTCRRCGAHLGHVFDDGPTMTGLRFCVNSAALKLSPPEGEASPGKASSRTSSRSTSKSRTKTTNAAAKSKARAKAAQPASRSQPSAGSTGDDPPAPETPAPRREPS